MENLPEKRRFERFIFQKPVRVYQVLPSKSGNIYEVQDQVIPAQSHNISESGLKLETTKPFGVGSILKLSFEVEKDDNVEIYAKIIWVQKTHCGVHFMAPDTSIQKTVRNLSHKTHDT